MTDPPPDAVARVLAEYGCGHHTCGYVWPCPTYRLAAALAAREQEVTGLQKQNVDIALRLGAAETAWRRKIEAFGEKAELSMEDQLVLAWDALGSAQRRAKVAEDTAADLRAQLAAAQEALRAIADPIAELRRTMPPDFNINGAAAVALANDANHLRETARAALTPEVPRG